MATTVGRIEQNSNSSSPTTTKFTLFHEQLAKLWLFILLTLAASTMARATDHDHTTSDNANNNNNNSGSNNSTTSTSGSGSSSHSSRTTTSATNNDDNGTKGDHNFTLSSLLAFPAPTELVATTVTTATITATTTSGEVGTTTALCELSPSCIAGIPWPKALAAMIFLLLILVTIVGNTLVILAVVTTRRLRTITNCFVLNLAITDWMVGTCVMPPSVVLFVGGEWNFGWILCDIWISLDILLSTGSILSLCAISLDRYFTVTQPLASKKWRSKRLALLMILVVWITALSITCPPYLGWYEKGRHDKKEVECRYNQNKGYVVFSAMGSFFIPLTVMMYVYAKIGFMLTSREQRIVRDAHSERTADYHHHHHHQDIDVDHYMSESDHYGGNPPTCLPCGSRSRWRFSSTMSVTNTNNANNATNNSVRCKKCQQRTTNNVTTAAAAAAATADKTLTFKHRQPTFYELVEISRLSSLIQCSAISYKYGGGGGGGGSASTTGNVQTNPDVGIPQLHYSDSQMSFSESCLNAATASGGGIIEPLPSTSTTITTNSTTTTSNTTTTTTTTNNTSEKYQTTKYQQQKHYQHHHHHHHHHHHRMPMRVSTSKRETKAAKTLAIVMGGLIACWLPFFVYYLLTPFLPKEAVHEGLMFFLTWIGWVNCAINPFIYAFYNKDFRTAFWRLTCGRVCKPKLPPNHMAMFRN